MRNTIFITFPKIHLKNTELFTYFIFIMYWGSMSNSGRPTADMMLMMMIRNARIRTQHYMTHRNDLDYNRP